jgi:hypothetical protein
MSAAATAKQTERPITEEELVDEIGRTNRLIAHLDGVLGALSIDDQSRLLLGLIQPTESNPEVKNIAFWGYDSQFFDAKGRPNLRKVKMYDTASPVADINNSVWMDDADMAQRVIDMQWAHVDPANRPFPMTVGQIIRYRRDTVEAIGNELQAILAKVREEK